MPKRKKTKGVGTKPTTKKKRWPLIGTVFGLLVVLYITLGRDPVLEQAGNRVENLNVILITIDTLRADFVGAYGAGRANTPHIDRLVQEGALFERCIAQVPLTLPSHTTILSGTYPVHHRVRDNGGFMVPDELRFVSEVLAEEGFATAAFVGAFVLHSKWGINQGFDTYSDDFDRTSYSSLLLQNEKAATDVLGEAQTWLRNHKGSRFFTWIHLFEPHSPYTPPPPYDKYPDEPYRGEVEYVDHALGGFIEFLEEQGLYNKSLIVLTSDHGEGLGQHREEEHGYFLYEPTVWVPLVMRAPYPFSLKRVPDLVELVDLAPTILDAVGASAPESYQGRSLWDRLSGTGDLEPRTAYTETFYPRLHYGWSELRALYREDWKYVLAPDEELYNLTDDEDEQINLAEKEGVGTEELREEIGRFIERQSRQALSPAAHALDSQDRRRLEALGYVTDTTNTTEAESLPDPKSKFTVFNALAKANALVDAHNLDEAMGLLKEIIESEPDIARAHALMGACYRAKRMYSEALRSHRTVLTLKPDDNFAMIDIVGDLLNLDALDEAQKEAERFLAIYPKDHNLLELSGLVYFYEENYDKAATLLMESIRHEESSSALSKLGEIYAIRKEYGEAETLIKRALDINAKSKGSYYTLALIEEAKGDVTNAISYYKKELENHPFDDRSSFNLANNLREIGNHDEANLYYRQTIRTNPRFKSAYFMIARYNVEEDGDLDEAINLCTKGVQLVPQDQITLLGYQILTDIYAKRRDRKNYDLFFSKGEELYKALEAKGQISIQ